MYTKLSSYEQKGIMRKKQRPEIIFYCPKCGKTPPKDKKMSNENWNVIPTKCPDCKIQLKIKTNQ